MLRKKVWLGELTIPIDGDVKHQTKQTKLEGFHSACWIIFRAFLKNSEQKQKLCKHAWCHIWSDMETVFGVVVF